MTGRRPLIGVTPQIDEENNRIWMRPGYMNGIENAGGVPVMLTLTTDADAIAATAEALDGFLFTGGGDINPALYGEEKLPECGGINETRDTMEMLLLKAVLAQGKPVLGICRGCQMINVGLGGTLYQDLPSQQPSEINHRQGPPFEHPTHTVNLLEGSLFRQLVGEETIWVNTSHHQAVKDLAPGMEVMAVAPDGVIESICMRDHKFLWAVQWHPEYTALTDPASIALFKAFVDAAKE